MQNRLKELRKKNHYTLDDIERLTGINRGTYSNYENEHTEPKFATWKKLSDFYDVTVPYLQGIKEENFLLKFSSKQDCINFIHRIMKVQNITVEDLEKELKDENQSSLGKFGYL